MKSQQQKVSGGNKGPPPANSSSTSSSHGKRHNRWDSNSDKHPTPDHQTPSKPSATPKDGKDHHHHHHPFSSSSSLAPSAANPTPPHGQLPLHHSPASGGPPFPHPDPSPGAASGLPPPPAYGFHILERRTIVLADGSVRSYFALPPDTPVDPAAERFFPYGGRAGPRPGLEHGALGLGYDKRFPHAPPPGGRFSPEGFREPPLPPYGRSGGPQHDYWSSLGLDRPRAEGPSSLKRKYEVEDEYVRNRQHVMQYGSTNPSLNPGELPGDRVDYLGRPGSPHWRGGHPDDGRLLKHAKLGGDSFEELSQRRGRGEGDVPPGSLDVDPQALKRAFLRFSKSINESTSQKKNYLEDGKHGRLSCVACGRSSKDFADMHGLIMHTYTSQNADLRVDHLGLHKAICVLLGWDYARAPDSSMAYRSFSVQDAAANREDLIICPPTVIIQNTLTGRRKDGRTEGMGNKEMDNKIKDLGFGGGKSKSLYGKDGHLGMTVVKFANTQAGLKEAERLAEYFERDNHGRRGWARAEASQAGNENDQNPALVKVDERTGKKERVLYGYLATASDLDKVDFDIRKKAVIKSRREFDSD